MLGHQFRFEQASRAIFSGSLVIELKSLLTSIKNFVQATLSAAREVHSGRLVVAFQPHRFTRTRDLWHEFIGAFNEADLLIVTDIYAAGEAKIPGVEAAPLVEAIRAHGHRDVEFVGDLSEVGGRLAERVEPGDLVLTLGAGSISTLRSLLLERLGWRG